MITFIQNQKFNIIFISIVALIVGCIALISIQVAPKPTLTYHGEKSLGEVQKSKVYREEHHVGATSSSIFYFDFNTLDNKDYRVPFEDLYIEISKEYHGEGYLRKIHINVDSIENHNRTIYVLKVNPLEKEKWLEPDTSTYKSTRIDYFSDFLKTYQLKDMPKSYQTYN